MEKIYMKKAEKNKELIHKLNHYLAMLYGNIEISLLSTQNKELFGENVDIVELLSEAYETRDKVKAIIDKISENIDENS